MGSSLHSSVLRPVAIGVALLALLAFLILNLSGGAHAATFLSADLTAPDTGAGATQLASLTCGNAASTLSTAALNNQKLSLPVGPLLFPTVTSNDLTIATDDSPDCTTLTLEGHTTILGVSNVPVLVVGQWSSSSSTDGVFTVFFKFSNVGLGSLVSAGSGLGVGLSDAWIAVTTSSSDNTVTQSALPQSAQSFLNGDFTAKSSGITFRGILDSTGDLAAGLDKLGVDPTSVTLDGSLTGSLSGFSTSAPPTASASLSLSASFSLNVTTPDWISFPDPFTLSLDGNSSGDWTISASGDASVTLPNTDPVTVSATISLTKSAGAVTAGLDVTVGDVPNAFGQSWLEITGADLTASVSSTGFSAELKAGATISGDTYKIDATLASDGSASVTASTSATIDAKDIATSLGLESWPTDAPDLSLSNFVVYLGIDTDKHVTVSATATATLTIGSAGSLSVDVLLRNQTGPEGGLLVAVRPSDTNLTLNGVLGTSLSPDVPLPVVSLVFATKALTAESSDLDGPTKTYFQKALCDASEPDCDFSLDVPAGVGIEASVTLPDSLVQMFCTMLSESTCTNPFSGPIIIDGQIPLFGGTTTSLTIKLPAITIASGAVQQLSADISISETDGSLGFSVGGTLLLFAPGTGGSATCPDGITPPSGDVCLDLSIKGALTVGSGGVSVTITGSLTGGNATSGWQLPDPVSWLTINDLTIQIGITAAPDPGLTLGARAAVLIGSTDLEFSIDLELTPEAPWVNLLGISAASENGLSMADLADLYTQVSGQSVDTSALPPLAVKNLYFSFSTVDNADLCLQQGLYISGELVLTNSGSTDVSAQLPTGQESNCTPPDKSSVCTADSSSCLASIFLSVSKDGIEGQATIGGWSAGPVSFDPTLLEFTLSSSEVQIHISGGGRLLDPIEYAYDVQHNIDPSTASTWLAGSLDLSVGTEELSLHATGEIGSKSASIDAVGSFNLSDPGFNLTAWFNDVKEAFNSAGQWITNAADTVASTAETWYNTYVAGSVNQVFTDIHDLHTLLTTDGQTQMQAFYNVYNDVNSAVSTWNSTASDLDLDFLEVDTNNIVNDALHGINVPGWYQCFGKLGCTTIIPGFTIPGVCSYVASLEGSQICTVPLTQLIAAMQAQFADPVVNSAIAGAGVTLPPNSTPGSVVKTFKAIDPPGPSSVTCAMATANYSTGYLSPTAITVNSLDTNVTFNGPNPTDLANSNNDATNNQTLGQNTINSLYSGQNTATCNPLTLDFDLPPVTMSLDHSWIHERDSVTASGYVTDSSITTVTIDWGDGSTPTNATVTSGQYTATHTYADESGLSGQSSPFTVTASTGTTIQATQKLAVYDKPIVISSLSATPGTVNIMDTVTVNGAIDPNPEPDETTVVTISWGDNTPDSTVTLGPSSGPWTFSAQHVYQQLVPSGQPSQVENIKVTAAEEDGTSTTDNTSVTVNDVPPSGTVLNLTGPVITSGGTVFTHSGATFNWATSALDITPKAVLTFGIDWADGTTNKDITGSPASGPDGQQMYTYSIPPGTHTFTNACFYKVQTSVTDSDTMSAPVLTTPVIATTPAGAMPIVAADWNQVVQAYITGVPGRGVTSSVIPCYLSIASYLSPQLGANLTPQLASSILHPWMGSSRTQTVAQTTATLKQSLLTSLLNFSNGTWDWDTVIDKQGNTFADLVTNANTALDSGSQAQMNSAIKGLQELSWYALFHLIGGVYPL
jgi:hypothetical protein